MAPALRQNRRMAPVPADRLRVLNARDPRPDGEFVLYWMIAARRVQANFALQRAAELAIALGRPLVVFEPLRVDYRWASDRLHRFVIDGMADQAEALARRPVTYLPHVERAPGEGRRLFDGLAARAAAIVTDDYPAFFLPRMVAAAAARVHVRLESVDSNGLLPIRGAGRVFPSAVGFRAHLQRSLRRQLEAWPATVDWPSLPRPTALRLPPDKAVQPTPVDLLRRPGALLAALPIDHGVGATSTRGGSAAAQRALSAFVETRLAHYADRRNDPDVEGTSGLSPYLHFGHLAAHDVFDAVMTAEGWTTRRLSSTGGGRRVGWWGVSSHAEAFLDQLLTWRELGFNMCAAAPDGYDRYESLPAWARTTLASHAGDPRAYVYSHDQLEQALTHDPVWNAAQRQLTRDGWMHNYLRMLWGKKILEWSPTPAAALDTMIALMNRQALDGRDPNSYAGYGWTLGRYDRPWGPDRPIFGTIRYMSSQNTVRKLKLTQYLRRYGRDALAR
jgi:deoxyribodipyrimidine photo-lyase